MQHSEYVRHDLAILRGVDPEDVEGVTHAFSFAGSAGFLWALYEQVNVNLALDSVFVDTQVEIGDGEMAYRRVRTAVTASLVWTL